MIMKRPSQNTVLRMPLRISKLFLVLFLFSVSLDSMSQVVVGSPGSKQSAVQRCMPASYFVTYSFEVDGGVVPTGYFRILFRLLDQSDNIIESRGYYNDATHNEITIAQSTDPPFNWVLSRSHPFTLPLETDCQYNTTMYFYHDPDGAGPLGYVTVDLTQTQPLSNWHTDDDGDGFINVAPDIEEVCLGQPLNDFVFTDASQFACVDPLILATPNHVDRYIQFVYGTSQNPAQSIPNLYINDGFADIQLTDATGNYIVFPTSSGFYEGPIDAVPVNPDGSYTAPSAYPISFDGVGTAVDDYFEVTVRNWNYCNPWNFSVANPNAGDARTDFGRILIVDGPLADAGFCEVPYTN